MSSPIEDSQRIAGILTEALPYIQRYHGKTIVIKYGGHAMENAALKTGFARDVVLMKLVGMQPVIVHGGGPQIDKMLNRVGIESHFIHGIRKTDRDTMAIVEMVLAGGINKDIVDLINRNGGSAVGLSGKDGGLIKAKKLNHLKRHHASNKTFDYGQVGEIVQINPRLIRLLDNERYIPVIAPIGYDDQGNSYNINADTVAGKIATTLNAEKLLLLTNTPGLLDRSGEIISKIKIEDIARLIADQTITGGMLPKIECLVDAVSNGVTRAHIVDGRLKHSVLLEVFTNEGIGSMLTAA